MDAKTEIGALMGGDGSMPSLKNLMQLKKKYDAPEIGKLKLKKSAIVWQDQLLMEKKNKTRLKSVFFKNVQGKIV